MSDHFDRAVDQLMADFRAGKLEPDLEDALVEDYRNWKHAQSIAASVFDTGVTGPDDPPDYTAAVREQFTIAMLHPRYGWALRRAAAMQGRLHGWSQSKCRALAQHFIYRWEHRNDPPVETAARMRSLADVLDDSEKKETIQ